MGHNRRFSFTQLIHKSLVNFIYLFCLIIYVIIESSECYTVDMNQITESVNYKTSVMTRFYNIQPPRLLFV